MATCDPGCLHDIEAKDTEAHPVWLKVFGGSWLALDMHLLMLLLGYNIGIMQKSVQGQQERLPKVDARLKVSVRSTLSSGPCPIRVGRGDPAAVVIQSVSRDHPIANFRIDLALMLCNLSFAS